MRFHRRFLYGLFVALTLIALPAFCQTITTGDVSGTVKDTTGAVVPGAMVTIRSDTGDTRTQATDNSGAYHFTFLKPGDYTLSAVAAGLKTDATKLAVEVGQAASVDLVAKLQATQEVVEVMASGSIVETENANLSTTYTTRQMEELPMPGGDITSIAFTAPGVVMSTGMGYGNFSSHGLPGVSNLFTINGNDYNDAYLNLNNSGASNLLLGANEVQEAAVVQNAYSVQYGREAGAQINYITKSGTNGFHGDLTYNWNGDRLNANDFFANNEGIPKAKAISNQWAADIGGPIRRDKTFFYADTEGLYYTLASSGVVSIPSPQLQGYILNTIAPAQQTLYKNAFNVWNTAPGVSNAVPIANGGGPLQDSNGNLGCGAFAGTAAPGGGIFGQTVTCGEAWGVSGSNTNKEHFYTFRVDHSITDKQKIYVRMKHDDGYQPTSTNLINPVFDEQSIQPEWDGAINYTYVISPTIVNSFIGSVLWYSAYFGPADVSKSLAAFPTSWNFNDGGTNGGGGFYPMGANWPIFPQGRDVGQGQLIDDLSINRGSHTIKIGENFRRNRVSDFSLLENVYGGNYSFGSLADFANGVTSGVSPYTQTFPDITTAHIRLYNIGVYAQDEWAAASNLKITFGLRLDRTGNPDCVDACFSRLNAPFTSSSFQMGASIPYNQSIDTGLSNAYYSVDSVVPQPRVGVVWSPRGANKTVVRAGFGIFADLAPAFLVSSLFRNPPYPYGATVTAGQLVDTVGDPNGAAASALAQFNAFKTGFFNSATLAQLETAVPNFGPFNYFSVGQHFGTPKFAEWSFEVEQAIGAKSALVVTYSGNHGYDLLIQNGWPNGYVANPTMFPNGFGGLPSTAPDPRFLSVTELTNTGISNYDGLTVQFRRAFAYGFQGQINYTWSHALDDISNGGSGLPFSFNANIVTNLSNPNLAANYGNSDYDIRHNLLADFVWDTPWKFSHRGLGYLLSDWTISSKFIVRSGLPESITDGLLASEVGNGSINATVLATALTTIPHSCGTSAVNVACFSPSNFLAQGAETGFGNIGRNSLYGPGYFDIDTNLYKNIPINERIEFVIGASAYNLLNHPHFADPSANLQFGGLGEIHSTVVAPTSAYGSFQGSVVSGRVLVLTAKFKF